MWPQSWWREHTVVQACSYFCDCVYLLVMAEGNPTSLACFLMKFCHWSQQQRNKSFGESLETGNVSFGTTTPLNVYQKELIREVVLPHGAFHAPLSLLPSPCFCHGLPLLSHFLSQLHHFPLDLLLLHLGLQGLPSFFLLYVELGLRQNGFLQGLFLPLQL